MSTQVNLPWVIWRILRLLDIVTAGAGALPFGRVRAVGAAGRETTGCRMLCPSPLRATGWGGVCGCVSDLRCTMRLPCAVHSVIISVRLSVWQGLVESQRTRRTQRTPRFYCFETQ